MSLFSQRPGGGADDSLGYSDYLIGNMIWGSQKVSGGRTTDGNCIILDNNNGDNRTPAYGGRFLVMNNLCVANGGRGIHMLKSNNVDVVNNTLYHDLRSARARGGGIDQHQGELSIPGSSNLRIVNNLSIAVPYGNVFDAAAMGTNVQLAGNMFYGPGDRQPPQGGWTWSLTGDPMLAAPQELPNTAVSVTASEGFRPLVDSPVVNGGVRFLSPTGTPITTVDFSGKARPTLPSVGAFEPGP
jgi:hypothetical protein